MLGAVEAVRAFRASPQIVSRRFALFRVVKFGVSAAQLDFCSGFHSRQLHQKGRRSRLCRGPAPVGGCSRRGRCCTTSGWRCHWGGDNPSGDNPSRTCDAAKVSARAAKRPVPRHIPALSWRTSVHPATALSAFSPRRLRRRIAPAINPQKKPTRRKNPRARGLFLYWRSGRIPNVRYSSDSRAGRFTSRSAGCRAALRFSRRARSRPR